MRQQAFLFIGKIVIVESNQPDQPLSDNEAADYINGLLLPLEPGDELISLTAYRLASEPE